MNEIDIREHAGDFMAAYIQQLADRRPDLANMSGRGFWPVPAVFPLYLGHSIFRLQNAVSEAYLRGDSSHAAWLAHLRVLLMRIVYEGDLGENHTELFLRDHPEAPHADGPFAKFTTHLGQMHMHWATMLGLLVDNEVGSLAEARALVGYKIIRPDGVFARVHLQEEVEHARIATEIAVAVQRSRYAGAFENGIRLHRMWYASIVP